MGLAKCSKHGFSPVILIGKDLKSIALQKGKLNHLVMLVYEFEYDPGDISSQLYYYFSPDEAEKINIPSPGLILRINVNAEIEPKDPYESVIREMAAMCSKCFSETYDQLLNDVTNKYADMKIEYLGYE